MNELKIFSTVILFNTIAILFFSCKDSETEVTVCQEALIEHFDMIAFSGEDLECHDHILFYQIGNEFYAHINNHCADFAFFHFIDCQGDTICATQVEDCTEWTNEAIALGVIGVREE